MAKKKTTKKGEPQQERGLTKMLAVTVVLGVVFSAGLITGQRLLRAESRAPLVSLSQTRADAPEAELTEESAPALRTTFSFYEHLTQSADAATPPTEPAAAAQPSPEKPNAQPAAQQQPAAVESAPAAAEAPAEVAAAPVSAEPEPAPTVVESPAAPAPAEAADEPAENTDTAALPARYTLQVSSHPDQISAESERDRLSKMGVEPHIVVVNVPGRGELWRVRVGKFHSMDEARDFQGTIKTKRGVAGFVTPL